MRNHLLLAGVVIAAGAVVLALASSLSDPHPAADPARDGGSPARPSTAPGMPDVVPRVTGADPFGGRVTGEDGTPIEGASVVVSAYRENDGLRAGPRDAFARVGTDRRGRFTVKDVPAGDWIIVASHEGHTPERAIVRRFDPGSPVRRTLVLRSHAVLAGRAVTIAGDPVPEAEISLEPSRVSVAFFEGRKHLSGLAPRATGKQTTDGEGWFEFADLPRGGYDLTVNAEGMVPVVVHGVRAPTEKLEIVLRHGIPLRGSVTWKDGVSPTNLTVKVLPRGPRVEVVSDERGATFETVLSPGTWEVTAYGGGTTAPVSRVVLEEGKAPPVVDLHLVPAAVASGRVTDIDTGRPVPGASVSFEREGVVRAATADENGRYRIALTPGRWIGSAGMRNHDSPDESGDALQMGRTSKQLDFRLRATCAIAGRVIHPDGGPAEATVRIVEAEPIPGRKRARPAPVLIGRRAKTDAGGHFRIEGVATWAVYSVEAKGVGEDNTALVMDLVFEEGQRAIGVPDMVVQRPTLEDRIAEDALGSRVVGRITDEENRPVPGAVIAVAGRIATADVDGRFELPGVDPGLRRPLVVATGFPPREYGVRKLRAGGEADVGDLVLPRRGVRLLARVADTEARPIPWARASVRFGEARRGIDVEADAFGCFELEGPSDRRGVDFVVEARVLGYGLARVADAIVTERVVEVVLEPFATLFGTLEVPGEFPRRASVAIRESHKKPWRSVRVRIEKERGAFLSNEVPAGRYQVRLTVPGYAAVDLGTRNFPAGHTTNVGHVPLQVGGVIHGRVHHRKGRAVAGLRVAIRELELEVRAGPKGDFTVRNVPPGQWTVIVYPSGRNEKAAWTVTTVKSGRTSKVNLRLE